MSLIAALGLGFIPHKLKFSNSQIHDGTMHFLTIIVQIFSQRRPGQECIQTISTLCEMLS